MDLLSQIGNANYITLITSYDNELLFSITLDMSDYEVSEKTDIFEFTNDDGYTFTVYKNDVVADEEGSYIFTNGSIRTVIICGVKPTRLRAG